ncbi:DUF333 domain-containing protein [Thioclava indica]|uniref:Hemolysin n=1 Tax=Thioclava indica TaxID=1353528 RepID=A0A074KI72_9RHOB|nr:DUF333 domain-containing protein [Thioclava indica]KEO61252.1 hypothetical protein DT23_10155 [Thioclava indica]
MKYISILIMGIALAACDDDSATPPIIGMANPASEYCGSVGGRLEIREEPDGQTGYCHLPDGRVVEEWELFSAKEV